MLKNISSLGNTLDKAEQKSISGGMIPFLCDVLCPSYCTCINAYNDYCVFNSGPRAGQYCVDL